MNKKIWSTGVAVLKAVMKEADVKWLFLLECATDSLGQVLQLSLLKPCKAEPSCPSPRGGNNHKVS